MKGHGVPAAGPPLKVVPMVLPDDIFSHGDGDHTEA
jgi:hypothetical protein